MIISCAIKEKKSKPKRKPLPSRTIILLVVKHTFKFTIKTEQTFDAGKCWLPFRNKYIDMVGFYHTWHRPAESDILVTNWIPRKLTKALFLWRKLVPSRSVTRPSKLPWANQNLPVHSHDKKLARLASPVFDGRVTLPHVDTVARSAGSTRSRRDNHSMYKRCCQPLARANGPTLSYTVLCKTL